jgi:hypothetical protein
MTHDDKGLGLHLVDNAWIETWSGQQFFFNDIREDAFRLDDIAHALSMLCRYNGHTGRFYSVAEHCILVADHVFLNADKITGQRITPGTAMLMARTALLHDVAEAYIGDMCRPLKAQMPEFKKMEQEIEEVAAKVFNLIYPFPDWLKDLDTRMLVNERRDMMGPSGHTWFSDHLTEIPDIICGGMNPNQARGMFMAMGLMNLEDWLDYASNRNGPFFRSNSGDIERQEHQTQ